MNIVKDLSYLAGVMDGEGCIGVTFARKQRGRCSPKYTRVDIHIGNTNLALINNCQRILKNFKINYSLCSHLKAGYSKELKDIVIVKTRDALCFCQLIEPYLIGKKLQCQLAIAYYQRRLEHLWSRHTDLDMYLAGLIKTLNRKGKRL